MFLIHVILMKGYIMSNFVTGYHDVVGTCYQGKIDTSYHRLVETFGLPEYFEDDDKVQVQWAIKFNDGTLATIYDWKDVKRASEVTEWHIGGHSQAAVVNVIDEIW